MMDPCRFSDEPADYLPTENKICETVLAFAAYFTKCNINSTVYSYPGRPVQHLIRNDSGFKEFYSYISNYRFETGNTCKALMTHMSDSGALFGHNLVIMVLHELDADSLNTAEQLTGSGISVYIYLITDDAKEADRARTLFAGKIFVIGTEDDLTEVL